MNLTFVRDVVEDREFLNYVALPELGIDVELVVARAGSGPYEGSGVGFPVTRLHRVSDFAGPAPVRRRVRSVLGHRYPIERLIGLESALEGQRVVCVNETHLPTSAQASRLRRQRTDLRLVTVCYENIPFRYDDDRSVAVGKDAVLAATDLFVAVTPAARDALLLEGVAADRIEVQPLGVDQEKFNPARRDTHLRGSLGAAPDEPIVMFVGRLLREKGLAELVLAASRVLDVPYRLVFVGSGSEEPRLRRMVNELRMQDRVRFLPWVPSADVPGYVASADVLALPSLKTPYWEEQLGYALIEAMASATPVLSTDSASIEYIVGDAGLLVDPYDIDALAVALRRLVTGPRLRSGLGDAGRARVEADLDARTVAARFATLVNGLQV